MYGRFSFSFVGVALLVALVVALLFFASPLFAVVIAVLALLVAVPFMSAMRARSRREDDQREPPLTPEGKPTSPTGTSSTGAPASGEG